MAMSLYNKSVVLRHEVFKVHVESAEYSDLFLILHGNIRSCKDYEWVEFFNKVFCHNIIKFKVWRSNQE